MECKELLIFPAERQAGQQERVAEIEARPLGLGLERRPAQGFDVVTHDTLIDARARFSSIARAQGDDLR